MLSFLPPDNPTEVHYRNKTRAIVELLRNSAVVDDEKSLYRKEVFQELGRAKLLACFAPKVFGGSEQSFNVHYTVLEEISKASLSMTVVVGVNNLIQGGLLAFGTETQKKNYLPKLIAGEWLGAFALSESGSGSDAASLRIQAKRDPGGYRINGSKMWCSNAGHADLYLLIARTGGEGSKGITAFLIEKSFNGFRVARQEKKLGLRGSTLAELQFEKCFVPESHRLGQEGEGFKVALSQLDAGRITIGVGGLGVAMEALDIFGAWQTRHPIEQGVKDRLAELFAKTQAVRLLVREAARLRDESNRLSIIASQVKLLGSDLSVEASGTVLEAMGIEGARRENIVERLLRDAKALQIVEGTNQIQRLLLSREMDKMYENLGTA